MAKEVKHQVTLDGFIVAIDVESGESRAMAFICCRRVVCLSAVLPVHL